VIPRTQGITVDSLIPDGAPPRIIKGEVVTDIDAYYQKHHPSHYRAALARIIPKPAEVVQAETVTQIVGMAASLHGLPDPLPPTPSDEL
jgi:hypothetical protein